MVPAALTKALQLRQLPFEHLIETTRKQLLIIILAGTIGRSVTGGQTWANLHYLLGLRALGHDAYYLEDVGEWSETYDWRTQCNTNSLDHPANYIDHALSAHGFGNKWIYRTNDDCRGMSIAQFGELCEQADLLLIRGVPILVWRPDYDAPRRRAFIDVDPGFTQIRLANREPAFVETMAHCESVFTYATRMGRPDCTIPSAERIWHPTVPPIDLDAWPALTPIPTAPWTTIVRWRGVNDVQHNGVRYGQRDQEFPKFFGLPHATGARFRIALIGDGRTALEVNGWEVVDGGEATPDLESYRRFISDSRGELGIAKQCYVDTRGGWISDRSVSYLAAGRPVIVQDTGIGDWLSVGRGVLTFQSYGDAAAAVADLEANYELHAASARQIAERFFDAKHVLGKLLDEANNSIVTFNHPVGKA